MIKKLVTLFHPERFQGWGVSKRYFEGWYFKIINADGSKAFAIIPGIAIDPTGNKHAFIQILDGKKETAQYLKFNAERFSTTHRSFEVKVAGCSFTKDKMTLCLAEVHGQIVFSKNFPWPSTMLSPGIMGPFTFVPFMECYHGIISMNNNLSGSLTINGELIDFSGGRGYIEKDWGHSFPEAYVWMQTNHFETENTSLKLSVAKIPWLKNSFVGFIVGFLLDGELYRFTTYNKTKLLKCAIDQQHVEIVMQNKTYHISIKAKRNRATALAAPINGLMDGKIEESMTAAIDVKLTQNNNNKVIFEGTGIHAGLEVAGKVSELLM